MPRRGVAVDEQPPPGSGGEVEVPQRLDERPLLIDAAVQVRFGERPRMCDGAFPQALQEGPRLTEPVAVVRTLGLPTYSSSTNCRNASGLKSLFSNTRYAGSSTARLRLALDDATVRPPKTEIVSAVTARIVQGVSCVNPTGVSSMPTLKPFARKLPLVRV